MTAPTVLAIDTSGPRLQLALARNDGVDTHTEDLPKGHAEVLFGRIAVLMERNGTAYADLTRIAVTTGPGSFTGLRIGLSAARGFGLAHAIPVIGIPTLTAISLGDEGEGPFVVAVDARRGEAWFGLFSAPGKPEAPAMVVPLDQVGTRTPPGYRKTEAQCPDIAAMARFALSADPEKFPPDPAYLRAADAKPQTAGRIALKDA